MTLVEVGTIIIAIVSGLTSSAAWQFYSKKITQEAKKEIEERHQLNLFQNDLKDRIESLEEKLEASYKANEDLQSRFLKLAETTAAMRVEIDYLRKENELLRKQLKAASTG